MNTFTQQGQIQLIKSENVYLLFQINVNFLLIKVFWKNENKKIDLVP